LHLSQIFLTLGWTFIELLSELTSGKHQQARRCGWLRVGHLWR
jgi:hypothetical protein